MLYEYYNEQIKNYLFVLIVFNIYVCIYICRYYIYVIYIYISYKTIVHIYMFWLCAGATLHGIAPSPVHTHVGMLDICLELQTRLHQFLAA